MVRLPRAKVVSAVAARSRAAAGDDMGTASLVPFISDSRPPLPVEAAAPTWTALSSAVCCAAAPVPVMSEDLPQPASTRAEAASQTASAPPGDARFIVAFLPGRNGAPALGVPGLAARPSGPGDRPGQARPCAPGQAVCHAGD